MPGASLVADLRGILRKGQDIIVALSGRASRQLEMANELAATKKANGRLEVEVARLKEAAEGDKKALLAVKEKVEAVHVERAKAEGKLKAVEKEAGALMSTLTHRER